MTDTPTPDGAGAWRTLIRTRSGVTIRERTLYAGHRVVGLETRRFRADGTIEPLADGRTSFADTHP